MKSQTSHVSKQGFTIIELLTVMSIIVVLIGLLVPALNQVRRYSLNVKQNAQFHAIKNAMELFRNETDGQQYPDSSALDSQDPGQTYPGAMKLCEAMMGQDLMGFHGESHFRADSVSAPENTPERLYRLPESSTDFLYNLKQRQGPYLEAEKVGAYQLQHIYKNAAISSASLTNVAEMYVIADVFKRAENLNTGQGGDNNIGMPVLYFKADPSGTLHDPTNVQPDINSNNGFIYNFYDNEAIVKMGLPWSDPQNPTPHAMDLNEFYSLTENDQIKNASQISRPHRPDSYLLMSAGWDGEFGTRDDITNFDRN